MKVYISGPITGVGDYIERFAAVEEAAREQGYEVVNPVTLPHDHGHTWEEYMREDLKALLECDYIFMIDGWHKSRGAIIELNTATIAGIKCLNPTNRSYTNLLVSGNTAQVEKLYEKDYKIGWDKLDTLELFEIIQEEFWEISDEVFSFTGIDHKALRRECADLANGCHFMIEYCDKILLNNK